jgi:hypothetical protein
MVFWDTGSSYQAAYLRRTLVLHFYAVLFPPVNQTNREYCGAVYRALLIAVSNVQGCDATNDAITRCRLYHNIYYVIFTRRKKIYFNSLF